MLLNVARVLLAGAAPTLLLFNFTVYLLIELIGDLDLGSIPRYGIFAAVTDLFLLSPMIY